MQGSEFWEWNKLVRACPELTLLDRLLTKKKVQVRNQLRMENLTVIKIHRHQLILKNQLYIPTIIWVIHESHSAYEFLGDLDQFCFIVIISCLSQLFESLIINMKLFDPSNSYIFNSNLIDSIQLFNVLIIVVLLF